MSGRAPAGGQLGSRLRLSPNTHSAGPPRPEQRTAHCCARWPAPHAARRCARVESSRLNERPDEDDSEVWRHGSFK